MSNVERLFMAMDDGLILASDIVELLLNFHGEQLASNDFMEFIEDEGYII